MDQKPGFHPVFFFYPVYSNSGRADTIIEVYITETITDKLQKLTSLYITDLLLFGGASLGFLLSLALTKSTTNKQPATNVLSLTLLLASLMLIGRLSFIRYPSDWVYQWSLLPDLFIFLFGPLSFLYAKRLISNRNQYLKSIDFALPGLFILVAAYLIALPRIEFMALLTAGKLNLTYSLIEGTAIVSNFLYWVKSFRLYRVYKREGMGKAYPGSGVSLFRVFLMTTLISWSTWSYGYIVYYLYNGSPIVNYDIVWIIIPISIYVVGYVSLREKHEFKTTKVIPETSQELGADEVWLIERRIHELILEGEFYLDKQLTLFALSEQINVSTNKLSWYLNNVQGCNFYDFVNELRVQAFIKRLEKGDHVQQTLLSLAMEVGFNSKSTFNKAFKMFVQETPSAYVKKYFTQPNLKVGANL